jgi:GrpB-like predicted nucleotidyltransferase (UPF0157 family)
MDFFTVDGFLVADTAYLAHTQAARWRHLEHHLYFIEHDDPHVRELLVFRDLLRSQAHLREPYELLKHRLAQTHRGDRESYTEAKRRSVEKALREAGIEPLPRPRADQ